jgi:hypothetical protein
MTLEQRLEKLERENRWMRRLGAVCLAVVAAVFLMGQDKPIGLPDHVVRSLTIMDGNGKVRAWLGTMPRGGVYLSLADKDAKPRAMLATLADGATALTLKGKDGKERVALKVFGDSSPRLRLLDAKGSVIWKAP